MSLQHIHDTLIAEANDLIRTPKHYTYSEVEVIDAIEAWGLGYHLGNVVKYVARSAHKGSAVQDLEKARQYINREINRRNGVKSWEAANVEG